MRAQQFRRRGDARRQLHFDLHVRVVSDEIHYVDVFALAPPLRFILTPSLCWSFPIRGLAVRPAPTAEIAAALRAQIQQTDSSTADVSACLGCFGCSSTTGTVYVSVLGPLPSLFIVLLPPRSLPLSASQLR